MLLYVFTSQNNIIGKLYCIKSIKYHLTGQNSGNINPFSFLMVWKIFDIFLKYLIAFYGLSVWKMIKIMYVLLHSALFHQK